MPHFVITSKGNHPTFQVWLADCTEAHAKSVLEQLLGEPTAPDDLQVTQAQDLYNTPPPKRRRLRRTR